MPGAALYNIAGWRDPGKNLPLEETQQDGIRIELISIAFLSHSFFLDPISQCLRYWEKDC
jgi:hypothetical protein